MLTYIKYEISFSPSFIGPPRGFCKVGGTNMVPKHEIYIVENTSNKAIHNKLRSHGPMYIVWYVVHC